jgi:hypothetical protein
MGFGSDPLILISHLLAEPGAGIAVPLGLNATFSAMDLPLTRALGVTPSFTTGLIRDITAPK